MYRPQESPANRYIYEGAGDAGGILMEFAKSDVLNFLRTLRALST
jgi:hypothetical protein